jgi:hypothetical protein
MCNCKSYDPDGETLTGYQCYLCGTGIAVWELIAKYGKQFCSKECFERWCSL